MGAIRFDSVVKDGGATVQPSEANTGLSRGYCVFSQLYRTMFLLANEFWQDARDN